MDMPDDVTAITLVTEGCFFSLRKYSATAHMSESFWPETHTLLFVLLYSSVVALGIFFLVAGRSGDISARHVRFNDCGEERSVLALQSEQSMRWNSLVWQPQKMPKAKE